MCADIQNMYNFVDNLSLRFNVHANFQDMQCITVTTI